MDARKVEGDRIVQCSWLSVIVFAIAAVLGYFDALKGVSVAICVVLFIASFPVWIYALIAAFSRSGQGDDIAVASLFFLQGSAPPPVQRSLLGAFGVSIVVVVATVWVNPFTVLVPMLQLGLVGLWGARYGTFPPRRMGRPNR